MWKRLVASFTNIYFSIGRCHRIMQSWSKNIMILTIENCYIMLIKTVMTCFPNVIKPLPYLLMKFFSFSKSFFFPWFFFLRYCFFEFRIFLIFSFLIFLFWYWIMVFPYLRRFIFLRLIEFLILFLASTVKFTLINWIWK